MKSQEDTVAVMVVFQPPESVLAAIEALLPQVKALVVVDNGKNQDLGFRIQDLKPESRIPNPSVHWIQSPQNNLADAQNLGIAKARELGADFVLLMDDDSLPAPDMVRHLRAAWQEGVAVVAPYLQEPSGRPPHYIQALGRWGFRRVAFSSLRGGNADEAIQSGLPRSRCSLAMTEIINNLFYVAASGSLIPVSVFDKLGTMDESLGIYFVDTDFCLRARKAGYDIRVVDAAKMQHRFGKVSTHQLLGRTLTTTNHPAAAREKMCRNRKVLWLRYALSDTGYLLFDMLRLLSEALRVALFEAQKAEKLKAMLRGVFSRPSSPRQ